MLHDAIPRICLRTIILAFWLNTIIQRRQTTVNKFGGLELGLGYYDGLVRIKVCVRV